MAQRNSTEGEDAQTKDLKSDQQATLKTKSAFRRRAPLAISPKRKDAVAVVCPMQQDDRSEPVLLDVSSPETSSPARSSSRLQEAVTEIQRRYRERRRENVRWVGLTRLKPFSFDARDAAQRVRHERRLQEIRQKQHQLLKRHATFKAHPMRRFKPIQPPTQSKGAMDN